LICPRCGAQAPVEGTFCGNCGNRLGGEPQAPQQVSYSGAPPNFWFENYYKINKKVLALTNQYWITDQQGRNLGYTKQKMFRLKEDIRIYTDDSMTNEVFKIMQAQIFDGWGTFDVIDSRTNTCVGKIKRKYLMSGFVADEYFILDPNGQQIGRIAEGVGRGLARKYMPLGGLVPEHVAVEFYGQEVARINQQFKIIGDSWEVDCNRVPPHVDRRTLLGCMIMMGMIERDRK
jgi:hypothetical protein